MNRIFVLSLVFALMAGPAFADDTSDGAATPSDPQAEQVNKDGEEKRIVCTRERATGSNRTKRVCRDAAAVEAVGEAHREALSRAQEQRYMPPVEN